MLSSISKSSTPSVDILSEEPPGDVEIGETLSVVVAANNIQDMIYNALSTVSFHLFGIYCIKYVIEICHSAEPYTNT